jgi:hypothetical protein
MVTIERVIVVQNDIATLAYVEGSASIAGGTYLQFISSTPTYWATTIFCIAYHLVVFGEMESCSAVIGKLVNSLLDD